MQETKAKYKNIFKIRTIILENMVKSIKKKNEKLEKTIQQKKDVIITFCAHNDDNIIGVGGTIAKHVKEGGIALSYISCFGEKSLPHMKPEYVLKTRVKESTRAKKILGDEIYYFGLREGKIEEDAKTRNIKEKIKQIIKEKKPGKIFTHSLDDPHPDHRATLKVLREALDEIKYKGEVYSFDVWNPINIRKRDSPKLVVDISDTFKKKIESFKVHKSQWISYALLGWLVWLKAYLAGHKNKCRYAEVFYKIN